MPLPKRGVSAKGRPDVREDESFPASSPRGRVNDAVSTPRGAKGRIESPTKVPQQSPVRKPRTTEDVRAEAFPIVPRGRGRPPSNKTTPVASKNIADLDASPSRRSRRLTEQTGDEEMPISSRRRFDSQSTIGSRKSPAMTPRRGRMKSEMEPVEDPPEQAELDETEGRGRRKRKLTEAAEAAQAQAQSRSRKTSRRISEKAEELQQLQPLDAMEPIQEELLTEPIEDMEELMHDEVHHEEMVHAVSPQDMYMQTHHSVQHQQHYVMGGARTRGMHIVSDHDEMLQQHITEHDEHAMEEMVVYDDEGNMMVYEGDEMAHEEIIDGDEEQEEEMMRHHDPNRHHMMPPHEIKEEVVHHTQQQGEEQEQEDDDDDDDELPPRLEPEEGPPAEEILLHESLEKGAAAQHMMDPYGDEPYMSPGGTQYVAEDGDDLYVDGMEMVQMEGDGGDMYDSKAVEFNFLDNKNVCCGLCGEIVPYERLIDEHLPMHHPEWGQVVGTDRDLEEISYDAWLKDQLYQKKKSMENGFRAVGYAEQSTNVVGRVGRNTRPLRRVSQVRVNPNSMSIAQLDIALKKKMIEKMGRKVKVTLVDKKHARCGICNAVVSLNKKFEVIHLVRHFNAWHPAAHRCQGAWPNRAPLTGPGKPLSSQDFAVVDVAFDAPESLQCIWCGMFMDRTMLAMHFHEVHPEDVEVPKCHLCLQEVVINARLLEKYGDDFEVSLPDEHHIKCVKMGTTTFATEQALDKAIERRLRKMRAVEAGEQLPNDDDDEADEDEEAPGAALRDPQYSNSRMAFGRRNKPKRSFIMPSLRQAIPQDSRYVEAVNEGEWRCKMCGEAILAAVISAGAIKHYRAHHTEQLEDMQYELCKARLERVSDGCMEFVHPQLIECLICNLTYALHKPYNMCRGIRHLKTKHPNMMPEYNAHTGQNTGTQMVPKKSTGQFKVYSQQGVPRSQLSMGQYVQDPAIISKLKEEYDIEFDKVQTMYGPDGEEIFVLVTNGQEVDAQVAQNIQESMVDGQSMEGDSMEGEDEEDGEREEGGVIVEEEEYQMDDEIVVRRNDGHRHMAAAARGGGGGGQRHQVGMAGEEEVVEEQQIGHHEQGGEEGEEQGMREEEEREMTEEDLVEQAMHDEQQPHFQ
ncbi:hypothetical protein PENTCL1PPCAC_25495 [Pristionchus entomophagus]|uniref:C2H2-type domain-containing protein n=1 Tax=Pristionchus entomophagus TaxID=358040 RepID=A0AAV5UA32_9BILA|nr:hypothetical protein PENTCL1PPCAC_25495 [Pristionchus entomophagus]